ncbi:basic proline-rich protein-like [Cavia porcellus]|uniref:basic proline-rich protein-like n=1 Tax=Cavia porcellus TaxID=10141 RepID=UPI002FDFE234
MSADLTERPPWAARGGLQSAPLEAPVPSGASSHPVLVGDPVIRRPSPRQAPTEARRAEAKTRLAGSDPVPRPRPVTLQGTARPLQAGGGGGPRGEGRGPAGAGKRRTPTACPATRVHWPHFLPEGAPKAALGQETCARRKPPPSPRNPSPGEQAPKRGVQGTSSDSAREAAKPVCGGGGQARPLGPGRRWGRGAHPGPQPPPHLGTSRRRWGAPGRARAAGAAAARGAPSAAAAQLALTAAPSPTARRPSPPPARGAGDPVRRPPRASAPRRPPPRRAALPPPPPHAARLRPGLGIKPAARAAAPGGRRGAGRPRAPGTTHRELGRRPAMRARGCRERRCWALGTGLAAPPPPPLLANADLKPGEGRGAQSPAPPRARRSGPRGVFITRIQRRGPSGALPGGWRGPGSRARPVRGLNK